MSIKSAFKQEGFALFFVSLLLFTMGLGSQEIIGFEARFYLFALEMWRHGFSAFPTTYHQPYPDYPVTSTYLIYLCAELFQHLNKWVAVLPSAVAAALTVVTTYVIGCRQNKAVGFAAVCFLFFTLTFVTEARTISLDMYIACVTTLAFYAVYTKKSSAWLVLLWIIGFAFRGPLGLIIPAGVVCVYYLLERNWRRFFGLGLLAAILLIVCAVVLMSVAYFVGDFLFVQDVLRMQVFGRMHDLHSPPVLFYWTECFGGYFVTYPLAFLIGLFSFKNTRTDQVLFKKLLGWALIILIGMSIPSDKKLRYILSIAPALALLCAQLFAANHNRYWLMLREIFLKFCFIFPLLGMVAVLFIHFKKPLFDFDYALLLSLLVLLQALIIFFRKNGLVVLAFGAFGFFLGNVFVVEQINLVTNRTRDFVLQTEKLRAMHHAPLVFFQEGPDGLPIKYLVNMSKETHPVFLYESKELLKLNTDAVVIVSEENFSHLPKDVRARFSIQQHGNIGHDAVVVLQANKN